MYIYVEMKEKGGRIYQSGPRRRFDDDACIPDDKPGSSLVVKIGFRCFVNHNNAHANNVLVVCMGLALNPWLALKAGIPAEVVIAAERRTERSVLMDKKKRCKALSTMNGAHLNHPTNPHH